MTPAAATAVATPAPAAAAAPEAVRPAARVDAFDATLRDAAARLGAGSDPAALGARVMQGLDDFRSRMGEMRVRAEPASGASAAGADGGQGFRPMLGLIVQTFDFAMETHLVAKAATQFTGSVNTMLKGQ